MEVIKKNSKINKSDKVIAISLKILYMPSPPLSLRKSGINTIKNIWKEEKDYSIAFIPPTLKN